MLPKRLDCDLLETATSVWISLYVLILAFLGEILFREKTSCEFYLWFVLDKLPMTK